MAGLGEACTHIGAVLFYLEASTKRSSEQSCTQSKCQWLIPSYQKEIPYLPIKDLDFSSAKKKHKAQATSTTNQMDPKSKQEGCSVSKPDNFEMNSFFKKLSESETRPAILSIVSPYSDNYIPKAVQPNFPKPLQQLYDEKYLKLDYLQLLAVCEEKSIILTKEMAVAVERDTRTQSSCNLWFTYRAGRVTASRMKAACHTDPTNPSQSLVKAISYPGLFKFNSKSTSWGCKHEKQARQAYHGKMLESHHKFSVADAGLTINPEWPFLGASPDGVVNCHCCSKGVVEIKCPYCHRNDDIIESTTDKKFCLKKGANDSCFLDKSHSYYYQVQTQIFICEVEYCDFVVCTFPENQDEPNIHIERLYADSEFWSVCIKKSSEFFNLCILPELVGRWYSRPISSGNVAINSPEPSSDMIKVYCYCKQPEDERQMIACDNPACSIEWFHVDCLKIKTVPKGKWFCPNCRVLPEFKIKKKKGN